MTPPGFDLVIHADWSTQPAKRWRASARRTGAGWRVGAARPVGPAAELLACIRAEAGRGAALLGVDLPIGVPAAWAHLAGVGDFLTALRRFGVGPWQDFYRPAATPAEISLRRPFYPAKPGAARQLQLTSALGVADMDALRRRCDYDAAGARAANPLFWTLGGAQVGKAAITFWRDVLRPDLDDRSLAIWPFEGDLFGLARGGGVVVAETYPGEVYDWFDLDMRRSKRGRLGRSKRRAADRAAEAPRLLAAGHAVGARFAPLAARQIGDGFPVGDDDGFDAMVGLLGLLHVLAGRREVGAPDDQSVRSVEGWILGRAAGAGPRGRT